jgi:hypothetical protein
MSRRFQQRIKYILNETAIANHLFLFLQEQNTVFKLYQHRYIADIQRVITYRHSAKEGRLCDHHQLTPNRRPQLHCYLPL